MAQEKFYANSVKWFLGYLKYAFLHALMAVIFWMLFLAEHEVEYIGVAALFVLFSLVMIGIALFGRSKITVEDGKVRSGRTVFNFADVIDVHRKKDEYIFLLSTRRRATIKLNYYGEEDKKRIDKLFGEECLRHMTTEEGRRKIAEVKGGAVNEFSVMARRSRKFWFFYLVISIYLGIAVLTVLVILLSGGFSGTLTPVSIVAGGLLLILLMRRIEKKSAKNVFSFRDDTFTLTHKDKTIFSFPRSQVDGVGINPQGKAMITFRLSGQKKRIRLPLFQFSRRDIKFLKETIRNIFFLAEKPPVGGILKNPIKF